MSPTEAATGSFPRTARLLLPAEFQRVFGHGRRLHGRCFTLHALPLPDGEPRLGLAVSRKVDRRAVARNRVKRLARETFRRQRGALPALALVLVARREAAAAPAALLIDELRRLFERAATLKPTGAAGTMPPAPVEAAASAHASTPRSPFA